MKIKETHEMSTYLMAFIVPDFNSTYSNNKHKSTEWVHPNAIANAAYSQDVGLKLVEYFADYTGIEYKLPQNDQVTVPDFASGAMENLGTPNIEVCTNNIL